MSGGPHHNPHGRQGQLGAGWNHLQVPEYFPRHPMAAHLSSDRPLTWHTPAPLVPPPATATALYRHSHTPPEAVQVLKGGAGSGAALYRHSPTPPDRDLKSFRHTPTPPDKMFSSGVAAVGVGTATDGRRCVPSPLLNLQHVMAATVDNVRDHYAMRVDDPLSFSRRSPAAPGSMDLSPAGRLPPNGDASSGSLAQTAPHPPVGLSVRDAGRINSLLAAARTPPIPLAPSVIVSAPPAAIPPPRPSSISDEDSCESAGGQASSNSDRRKKPGKIARAFSGTEPAQPESPAAAPNEPTPSQLPPCERIPDRTEPIKIERVTDTHLENGLSFNKTHVDEPVSILPVPSKTDTADSSGNVSDSASIVSKARRKSSYESETIDDIAALIASTDKIHNNGLENHDSITSLCDHTSIKEINPIIIDKLKNVLSSPVRESEDQMDSPTVDNPTSPKRRKTNCESNSTELPKADKSNKLEPLKTTIESKAEKSFSVDTSDGTIAESNLSESICDKIEELEDKEIQNSKDLISTTSPEKQTSVSSSVKENVDNLPKIDDSTVSSNDCDKSTTQPSFVEVENALEKMFAGLEDSVTDTQKLPKNTMPTRKSQTRSRQASRRSSEVTSAASSEEITPKRPAKKKLNTKEKPTKPKKLGVTDEPSSKLANKKEVSKAIENVKQRDGYDSGSNASSSKSRGPYIQIKGPRDSPISVEIVNAPLVEEDPEKSFSKVKAIKGRLPVDVRDKVKSKGLHSSTLSIKYDAVTSDPSWICVFCKRGSHSGAKEQSLGKKPMGDLFGPYTITKDCNEYKEMLQDPHDLLFKSKPKKLKIDKASVKKEKDVDPFKVLPHSEVYAGMSGDGDQLEVWMHEDCAVWAPHIRLCGGRVVGLDAAVWVSCVRACDVCGRGGAVIACTRRMCTAAAHMPCARSEHWLLIDDDFRAFCHKHLPSSP